MAKKKELTPEETLQQALVPKEEQPLSVAGRLAMGAIGRYSRMGIWRNPIKKNSIILQREHSVVENRRSE